MDGTPLKPSLEPLFEGHLDHEREPIARILRAAERCFYSRGYARTTIRQIAAAAEVSKSLLHYHFHSKEHLFFELELNIFNRLAERLQHVAAGLEGSPVSKAARMLDELYEIFEESAELPLLLEIWSKAWSNRNLKRYVVEFQRFVRCRLEEVVENILGDAIEDAPMTASTASDLLLSIFIGLKLQAGFDSDTERVKNAFEDLKRIVVAALESPARPGERERGVGAERQTP